MEPTSWKHQCCQISLYAPNTPHSLVCQLSYMTSLRVPDTCTRLEHLWARAVWCILSTTLIVHDQRAYGPYLKSFVTVFLSLIKIHISLGLVSAQYNCAHLDPQDLHGLSNTLILWQIIDVVLHKAWRQCPSGFLYLVSQYFFLLRLPCRIPMA